MKTTRHKLTAEIEVRFKIPDMPPGEYEVANPKIEITYDFVAGGPSPTPRGEYGPIDPPDPDEVSFVSARLVDGDGLNPTPGQVDDWASEWLGEEGYAAACRMATE